MGTKFTPLRFFIVEDDPIYTNLVKYVAELDGDLDIHIFKNGKECLNNLHLNPSIISLDYMLSDMNGGEVIKKIKNHNEDIEVIILSGQKEINVAVQLIRTGASDYIEKGDDTKDLLFHAIQRLKSKTRLRKEVEQLKEELSDKYATEVSIYGNSKAMKPVFKLVSKAANSNITVSITGETGTGKELVAKTIHYESTRRNGNFVAVNVSAIPNELLESELFGYEKGAFTGASMRKPGQFELANEGTLFLDEIAEMDIRLQAKLLRAIQEREVMRIGGTKPIPYDARILVATHRDMTEQVEKGLFREDLYYRLLGLPIELPPLRERGNDILLLAKQFLKEYYKKNKLPKTTLSNEAKDKLMNYNFPGNVRELKAIVELATVMCEDNCIEADDIRFNSRRRVESFLSNELTLKEYNEKIILFYLTKYDNDVLKVAKKLNIGKSTIYRLLKDKSLTG